MAGRGILNGHTPIDEIARGLEDLVKNGKVVYTGLANFPAWKALNLRLTTSQVERLDVVSAVSMGYPSRITWYRAEKILISQQPPMT